MEKKIVKKSRQFKKLEIWVGGSKSHFWGGGGHFECYIGGHNFFF